MSKLPKFPQNMIQQQLIKCAQCAKSFIRPQFLNLHILTGHRERHPCDDCNEVFSSPVIKNMHICEITTSNKRQRLADKERPGPWARGGDSDEDSD